MKILHIGDSRPLTNSRLRADALERLGHQVVSVCPFQLLGVHLTNPFLQRVHYHTGYELLDGLVASRLSQLPAFTACRPDVIWGNGGEWFGPKTLALARRTAPKVVLYVNDDPTGSRDGNRWRSLRKAVPFYDLIAVVREVNIAELRCLGASNVMRIRMSYDELVHQPPTLSAVDHARWDSEVCFVGAWQPERGPLLAELIRRGVPVSIWGNRWHKAAEWPLLRKAHRGDTLASPEYVKAIACAKVSLGLLSKGNRDLHTRRSVEIPYIGGLLCGERTVEHAELFRDGEEAVFWSSPAECAEQCQALLQDAGRRERIRLAGMAKVRQLKVGNEDVCAQILAAIR